MVSAQQYLYIKKSGDLARERLTINDRVYIKVKDNKKWIGGMIKGLTTKSMDLGNSTYAFADIEAMKTYNSLLRVTGTGIAGAGVLFTGIAFFNRLVNGDTPLLFPGQIAFGSGMLAGGLLVRWLSVKKYKKSKGWTWEVIDLDSLSSQ